MNAARVVPDVMEAVLLTGHGGYDRLEHHTDVPVPRPGADEVLVRVWACGFDNTDVNTRTGPTTHRMPMLVAHLATSTPPDLLRATTDLQNYIVGSTGSGGATVEDGHLIAPDEPGLGVEPAWDELGDPVAEYTR